MKKIIGFSILLFLLIACKNEPKKALPYFGHYDLEYRTENGKEVIDTIFPKVPSFMFLNQDSAWVKKEDYDGKLLIVDFMFTHCPSICPPMTTNMNKLATDLKDLENEVQFISFTIDPDRDTPSRLREYMKEMNITAKNWTFLTGDEKRTYELAFDYFYVGVQRSDDPEEDFLHDDKFVLIDKEGYVRGFYSGLNQEHLEQVRKDVRKLLKVEYDYQ